MGEMVERVRGAVEDEYATIFGKRCSTENARRLAVRVIDALYDPTQTMREAGWQKVTRDLEDGRPQALIDLWQAMIDEGRRQCP